MVTQRKLISSTTDLRYIKSCYRELPALGARWGHRRAPPFLPFPTVIGAEHVRSETASMPLLSRRRKASESPGHLPCDTRSARPVADLLGVRRNRAIEVRRLASGGRRWGLVRASGRACVISVHFPAPSEPILPRSKLPLRPNIHPRIARPGRHLRHSDRSASQMALCLDACAAPQPNMGATSVGRLI